MDVAVIEVAEWSCSNFDEMVEVPVLDPCRNPLNEDSWTADEDVMDLVAVSWDDIIEEATWLPPIAWLADA